MHLTHPVCSEYVACAVISLSDFLQKNFRARNPALSIENISRKNYGNYFLYQWTRMAEMSGLNLPERTLSGFRNHPAGKKAFCVGRITGEGSGRGTMTSKKRQWTKNIIPINLEGAGFYFVFKNSSDDKPACLKIARNG